MVEVLEILIDHPLKLKRFLEETNLFEYCQGHQGAFAWKYIKIIFLKLLN